MVNKLGDINGIPLYEDPSMEDGKVIKGRKGYPENKSTFMMANPKTAKFIYNIFIRKERREKLEKLYGI